MNIGWGKQIRDTLIDYDLPTDFSIIKNTHPNIWKTTVKKKVEKKNLSRLQQECHKQVNGIVTEKTKTKSLIARLSDPMYKREALKEITNTTKQEAKTIMITRFGMLECGKNFRGSLEQLCNECDTIDDENHRLNSCIRWKNLNLYGSIEKVDVKTIFSENVNDLRTIISIIETVWNTKNAHGTMNIP